MHMDSAVGSGLPTACGGLTGTFVGNFCLMLATSAIRFSAGVAWTVVCSEAKTDCIQAYELNTNDTISGCYGCHWEGSQKPHEYF